jgi:hypothetical protein
MHVSERHVSVHLLMLSAQHAYTLVSAAQQPCMTGCTECSGQLLLLGTLIKGRQTKQPKHLRAIQGQVHVS